MLLGLNGLRVSEACATNIEDLGIERRHGTLRIIGKGNQPAVVPLVPRTARTIDLVIGERTSGPILVRRDTSNHRIRKITSDGVVSNFAGSGAIGSADGTGTAATFSSPTGIVVDGAGNVYVSDIGNHRIRKISPAGVVSTLAGSTSGFLDATGTAARFNIPQGIALDAAGNLYVTDAFNMRVRKITPAGVVTTATGTYGAVAMPEGVAVDAAGNVYIADHQQSRIRKITPTGVSSVFAGSGVAGYADGTGTAAQFNRAEGIGFDAAGNLYVADTQNNRIRMITPAGVVTTVAGSGTAGRADGTGTAAQFSRPQSVVVDATGRVYVADRSNHMIRVIG